MAGLQTGISVVPATFWTVPSLASAAATTAEITGGRFTLGVGSGDIHDLAQRRLLGLQDVSPLALARDYLATLRAMLAGQESTYDGPTVRLDRFKLEFDLAEDARSSSGRSGPTCCGWPARRPTASG